MIGQTYRGYVDVATTKNTIVTAPKGVGVNKVLAWGKRPAGETRAHTREIRQGGVGG
jgi:hypothetical protein